MGDWKAIFLRSMEKPRRSRYEFERGMELALNGIREINPREV